VELVVGRGWEALAERRATEKLGITKKGKKS